MNNNEMKALYKQISSLLKELDFDSLWKGFSPYPFALYGEDKAVFEDEVITRPKDFYGNTSVVFRGKPIAIWNVVDSFVEDNRKLTSKIVHEMFHAEQSQRKDNRWANEEYGVRYDFDTLNLSIKAEENRLLALGLKGELSPEEAIARVVALRRYRREHFYKQFDYEMRTETMEGTAQFVESLALEKLSGKLYGDMINTICKHLTDVDYLLKLRFSCYDSGTAFLRLAYMSGIPIPYSLAESETVFDLLSKNLPAVEVELPILSSAVVEAVEKLMQERTEIISKALKWNCETIDAVVCGFDPLNTFFHNGMMYAKYLSVLEINGETQYLSCEHVFLADTYPKVTKVYKNPDSNE